MGTFFCSMAVVSVWSEVVLGLAPIVSPASFGLFPLEPCLSLLRHFQCSASESHTHWISSHDHLICSKAFWCMSVWAFTALWRSDAMNPLRKWPHPTLVCARKALV
jgi:hypothetical protein